MNDGGPAFPCEIGQFFIPKAIIDKYPETEYVVGISWMMDTPIAKKYGFSVVSPEDINPNNLKF